jgi:hypothetical protein
MSHHIGRWGHWGHQQLHGHSKTHIILRREGDADETLSNWGHQRLHGYSQTHVLLKRELLQTKSCLTPIVARDRDPAETQRPLGSAPTRNDAG